MFNMINPRVIYRIASFNIKQFSDNSVVHSGAKDSKKDLETISRIINDNDIDIIAIQEIRGKLAFKELISSIAFGYSKDITAEVREEPSGDGQQLLKSELYGADYLACKAGKWQGRWTHPNSKWGTAISEEGYAFIWNTDKFDLKENKRGKIQPVIKHKKETFFVRPPFYGRFVTKGLVPFEIRLLNAHILYTKNAKLKKLKDSGIDIELLNSPNKIERMKVKKEMLDYGLSPVEIDVLEKFSVQDDIERRKSEVHNLIREVLSGEEDNNGSGAYAFLLGDYNLNISNIEGQYKNKKAIISEEIPIFYGSKNSKIYLVTQKQLSTLKIPKDDDLSGGTEGKLANNYDHFTYNKNLTEESGRGVYISNPKVIDVITEYGISANEYFTRISDHLPIMIEIGF